VYAAVDKNAASTHTASQGTTRYLYAVDLSRLKRVSDIEQRDQVRQLGGERL
jgi:hypothetical protein